MGPENMRLLPWTGPEGKPAYLVSDDISPLGGLADGVERLQLAMGADLLERAAELLALPQVSEHELRFLAQRLTESLIQVHRIAESRGDRLDRLPPEPPDSDKPGD